MPKNNRFLVLKKEEAAISYSLKIIVNLQRLILISNLGIFKFQDQSLISQLQVSLQGISILNSINP